MMILIEIAVSKLQLSCSRYDNTQSNRPVSESNLSQAVRLYRKSLKLLSSWCVDRELFCQEADKLRARFDANRGCTSAKALNLMRVSSQHGFYMKRTSERIQKKNRSCHQDYVLTIFVFSFSHNFRPLRMSSLNTHIPIHISVPTCPEALSICATRRLR